MKYINPFYLGVLLTAVLLVYLLRTPPDANELAFYGFAESAETEINYNYAAAVQDILVRPGQAVDSGTVLLRLLRRNPKDVLADQPFRIEELRAEETAWRDARRQELRLLAIEYDRKEQQLANRLREIEEELAYQSSLPELSSIDVPRGDYQPLQQRREALLTEQEQLSEERRLAREAIESELQLGSAPYRERVARLEAEAGFDEQRQEEEVLLRAPATGLVGSINCREGEFKGPFSNLMTFYEPHSELIKGYVHEDMAVAVSIGDPFLVSSLKLDGPTYAGRVIGLGSRIVEIPERLRKYPTVKSYGREVTVEIPRDNRFLQREKVSLRYHHEAPAR